MVDCGKIERDFALVSGDYFDGMTAVEARKVSFVTFVAAVPVAGAGNAMTTCCFDSETRHSLHSEGALRSFDDNRLAASSSASVFVRGLWAWVEAAAG